MTCFLANALVQQPNVPFSSQDSQDSEMIDSETDSEISRTPQAHMPGSPFSTLQANNIPANLLASQALQLAAAEIPAQQQQQQFQLANPNLLSAEKSIRVQFLTTKQVVHTPFAAHILPRVLVVIDGLFSACLCDARTIAICANCDILSLCCAVSAHSIGQL